MDHDSTNRNYSNAHVTVFRYVFAGLDGWVPMILSR